MQISFYKVTFQILILNKVFNSSSYRKEAECYVVPKNSPNFTEIITYTFIISGHTTEALITAPTVFLMFTEFTPGFTASNNRYEHAEEETFTFDISLHIWSLLLPAWMWLYSSCCFMFMQWWQQFFTSWGMTGPLSRYLKLAESFQTTFYRSLHNCWE